LALSLKIVEDLMERIKILRALHNYNIAIMSKRNFVVDGGMAEALRGNLKLET